MKRKAKLRRKVSPLLSGLSPTRIGTVKPPGVDLGTLQSEFVNSGRTLKSAETKLSNAQDAHDAARAAHNVASDKLKASSRAVLAAG
jgi:hypothetical protein